jgi:hypothetical protein
MIDWGDCPHVGEAMEQLRAPSGRGALRMWLGAVLTIVFVWLAAMLIWAIDGLPVGDPLDRWLLAGLAAPFWLLAPVIGGFAWRPSTGRQSWAGLVLVGLGGTTIGAIVFWPWTGPSAVCFGTVVNAATSFMPEAVLISVVFGGGVALITLIVANLVRHGARWRAAFSGAGLQVGLFVVLVLLGYAVSIGHVCRLAPVPAQP